MREPTVPWRPALPPRHPEIVLAAARGALAGCRDAAWELPGWLLSHQRDAARRLAAALRHFGGALLADAVGLGKSYLALALATRYHRTVVLVPAAIRIQWRRLASRLGVAVEIISHEATSRGARLPHTPFVVIDEAHRFRNPATRRYDHVCRSVRNADVLLLTATPVVNHARDLVHLLRLFLSDHALAPLGVESLLAAAGRHDDAELLAAVAPFTVARTAGTVGTGRRMPLVEVGRVLPVSPVSTRLLPDLLSVFAALRFPSFGAEAGELLRLHLLYRLASSGSACLETLRRHDAYLRHALAAAERGERLPRGAARLLLHHGDEQLEFSLERCVADPIPAAQFASERQLVRAACALLQRETHRPKTAALLRLLAEEEDGKCVVFTAAAATATDLAAALGWRRLAVATGRAARIASGRIGLDQVLDAFAPTARRRRQPSPECELDLLIATDLASEGLDLHDASRIVHYDLPWTPFRLEQRLGRLVRLGSLHRWVRVHWFVPPDELDRRLRLVGRLNDKADTQLRSLVPSTSHVGRAPQGNRLLRARERLADAGERPASGWSVVWGPPVAAVVLRWRIGTGWVRQVVTLPHGEPAEVLDRLAGAPAVVSDLPQWCDAAIGTLVSARIRAMDGGASHAGARHLIRRVLRRARAAAARRDAAQVAVLDEVLDRLHRGLTEGDERSLRDALNAPRPASAVRQWLGRARRSRPVLLGPVVEAVIAGSGQCDR